MRTSIFSLAVIALVVTAAATSSCTILFATTSSEENLPCGPVNGDEPRCLADYTCVTAADGIDRCVRAGFKAVGDACVASTECADGGICGDGYANLCPAGSTDPNCARLANADTGLRCRAPCDDANGFTCESGSRCFFNEGNINFCQVGICASDSDCSGDGVEGICVGEILNGGRSGLCAPACDPLRCFDRDIAGNCPCADDEACATPPDETGPSAHNICTAVGDLSAPAQCDVVENCIDGDTCVQRGDVFLCVQWCRVGGGAPSCPGGINCVGVDPAQNTLGICQ